MDKQSPKLGGKKGKAAPNRDAKSLGKSPQRLKNSPASSKSPAKKQRSKSPKNPEKKDPNKVIVGNFSFMRDMIKEGGRAGDSQWILSLRPPRPFSSYKKNNTVAVGFNFGDKAPSSDKRIVVEFKSGEHPEAVSHLLNHRVASTTNKSLASFETGLRSYPLNNMKSGFAGAKTGTQDDTGDAATGAKVTNSLPALKFVPLPYKERKEFPQFVLSTKELEQSKKKMNSFAKEHLNVVDIFQTGKKGRNLGGKEDELRPNSIFFKKSGLVSVSAQDGRESFPEYFKIEKPDKPNIEPFRPFISAVNDVTALKWAGDLRICKPRNNHKLKPFKYKVFLKDSQENGDSAKPEGKAAAKDKSKVGPKGTAPKG